MSYSFLNFLLLIIIIVIIIVVFTIAFTYYYKICYYISDIADKAKGLMPRLHSDDETMIKYPKIFPFRSYMIKYTDFSEEMALLLGSVTRSAYNLSKNKESYLPEYLELIESIGRNGYLLKVTNYEEGNNIYILAYRGTTTIDDLCTDIDSVQTDFIGLNRKKSKNIKVHRGFYTYWDDSKDELKDLKSKIRGNDILIITGHSLGCSSAALSALSLSSYLSDVYIKLYMFAPPRLGNNEFIYQLDNLVPDNWAIINSSDIVPELPPVTLPTIGNNWIYDNWTHKILLDIQYGSILLNHKLSTYMCGFNIDLDMCPSEYPKWNREYIKIIKALDKADN